MFLESPTIFFMIFPCVFQFVRDAGCQPFCSPLLAALASRCHVRKPKLIPAFDHHKMILANEPAKQMTEHEILLQSQIISGRSDGDAGRVADNVHTVAEHRAEPICVVVVDEARDHVFGVLVNDVPRKADCVHVHVHVL